MPTSVPNLEPRVAGVEYLNDQRFKKYSVVALLPVLVIPLT